MQDYLRQIAVVVTVALTLVVNGLTNTLPINGQTTGEISDRFRVYFVPAGYVFAIWGVIYLGLIVFAAYQALPAQRDNPRLRATGWWIALGGLANSAWIFLWHYEYFALTLVAMLVLLATLVITFVRLGIGRAAVSAAETWAVRAPFSVYLGWITVATVANVTAVLHAVGWDGFGIAPEIWMGLVLAAVVAIATFMAFTRRDEAYALALLWALAGISVRHSAVAAVAIPTWAAFGLVALTLASAVVLRRRRSRLTYP